MKSVAIGRVLNDERFAFRQFSSHLKIYALQNDGKKRPLVSDCIQWLPSKMNSYRIEPDGKLFPSRFANLFAFREKFT